jgi:predicted DNA-binding protein (MmcQ/YjbR family)
MDAERLRTFLLTLPHVTETQQWGNNLLFWVGDKAIGGKMFTVINLDDPVEGRTPAILSYAAGPERFPDLLERDGLYPAPYMARIHWVAAEHWQVFTNPEWEEELRNAHALTLAKLPPRTRTVLAMPRTAQRRILHDRKQLLAAKASHPAQPKKKAAKKPQDSRQTTRGTKAGKPRSGRAPSK